jgi:predicted chitinase
MSVQLTKEVLRGVLPKAPQVAIDAFVAKQEFLDEKGVNHTRQRLAYALAQLEHESMGFTHLRENLKYSAVRLTQVWPNRFPNQAAAAPYANNPEALAEKVYGGRMGNTSPGDGARYIGRGATQITGKDGYTNVARHSGVPFDKIPELAEKPENQPELAAGFIDWKRLNVYADRGDFRGYVKIWNGGLIGMADRERDLRGNAAFIARLEIVDRAKPELAKAPGAPPTPEPPKEDVDEATAPERKIRNTGAGAGAAGGAGAGAQTVQPDKPMLNNVVTSSLVWGLVGLGVVIFIVGIVLVVRRKMIIKENWK